MAKKTTANTTATETSQQKLARLSGKRVPKAIKAIQGIGNLVTYKPTAVQAKAIINALDNALKAVEQRLTHSEQKTESQFSLPSAS